MGLDMYMHRRIYVKNWEHTPKEQKYKIIVKQGNKPLSKEELNTDAISEVIEDVAYWRKSNAIHQWFVDNVQDGNDNCAEYYVSREKLEELVGICEKLLQELKLEEAKVQNGMRLDGKGEMQPIMEDGKIISNPELADELLPTQSGFFFGSTDYDQWYYEDLQSTVDMLKPHIRKDEEGNYISTGSYYYSSSW